MKKTKDLFPLVLSIAMLFCMTSCASKAAPTSAAAIIPAASKPETAAEEAAASSKTLVIYFSASGNTQRVAETIAQTAGADVFEIVPVKAYSRADLDWTSRSSRVSREHDDESLRNVVLVSTEVPGWNSYDTVLIGYPIWWGNAAWPVNTFVKANDFTGKTVIPFATSSSSGMGQSSSMLAAMANGGNWQVGQRFSSSAYVSDIQKWVNELGL